MINIKSFTEKYRPVIFNELILKDKLKLKSKIENNRVHHLLLYSNKGGTGKGSIINAILNQGENEFKIIDCSINGNKEYLANIVNGFATTSSFYYGKKKVLVLDEVNRLSPEAFEVLKIPIEKYSHNCMFIIATNEIQNIPHPVLSRFFKIDLSNPNKDEILERLKFICDNENIRYNEKVLEKIIDDYYPSIREMIIYIEANQDELCDEIIETSLPNENQINHIWRRFIQLQKIIPILNYCQKNNLNYYEVVKSLESPTRIKNVAGSKTNEFQRLIVDYKNKMINEQNSDKLMEDFLHKFDKILSKK